MIHRENKEFFCYETYANQMACSQKFKQIEQVIMYPEKKAAVILFLSQLFKNIETETCFSRNVKLAFLDFLSFAKDEVVSLEDIQAAYNKIAEDEWFSQFSKKLDHAFRENQISLKQHYSTTQFLTNMKKAKVTLALMTEEDAAREDKYEVVKTQTLKKIVKNSELDFYFKATVERYLGRFLKETIPNGMVNMQEMVLDFIDLKDEFDFKSMIIFLNKYYASFPPELQLALSPLNIESILQDYLKCKPYFAKNIGFSLQSKMFDDKSSHYKRTYNNVVGFYHQERCLNYKSFEEKFPKIYLYTKDLVKEDRLQNELYHLALLQEGYGRLYISSDKNTVDKGIFYVNNAIRSLLQNINDPQALLYLSKVGRELLFQLTDPGKCFWMSGWFSSSHQQTKVRLPDFMRKALSPQSMHPVEYKKIGEARIKIFSMLSKRELKYRNEIDNLILQMNDTSFVLDESLVQKLILRLVAVNYLWEKVFCNQLISSEDLTKKMEHLFGKAIFETRNLMHSSLKDIIKEIEQLVPSKTSCMTVENSLLKERGLRISKHI